MDIRKAIKKVVSRKDLSRKEMESVFRQIMSGKATPSQIGSFITALRMKGETVEEITGAACVMREKALKVKVKGTRSKLLDTCGTGGTGMKAFNISTASAIVSASCGVKVAKHGNRAISSSCGSADVLERLGVKIDISPARTAKCIKEAGIGFLFAPLYHGAMKYALAPRREIGMRTVFNILGPLSNPASAKCQVLGVYDASLTEVMARVLKELGSSCAFVVSGEGPLDEVSISGRTKVSELKGGRIKSYYLTPRDFGIKKRSLSSIKGGTSSKNAKDLKSVLSGKKGAKRDIVLMNSSIALLASGKAKNIKKGMAMAAGAIDSGKALKKLKELARITNGKK